MKLLAFLVLVLLGLSMCDPCNDCGPVSYEPTVDLVFINGDSLQTVNDSLSVVNQLIVLVDTLENLEERIEDGVEGLEDDVESTEQQIDALTPLRTQLTNFKSYLSGNKVDLTAIQTLIESGSVWVQSLTSSAWSESLNFDDSLTLFSIPLIVDNSQLDVSILLNEVDQAMVLTYEVFTQVNEDRQVLIRTTHIDVTTHSFDSVRVECTTAQCRDNETIITAYF